MATPFSLSVVVRGEGCPGLLWKETVSYHCRTTVFLDKTACVSYGQGQDYLGEGVVHDHPFSPISEWKEVRGSGGKGGGGDNRRIQMEMGILHHLGEEG